MTGYIKLFRMLLDNPLCTQLPAGWFRIWIVCLMLTNFRPARWWNGTREVAIPAGSFVTSLPKLAESTGTTVSTVRCALQYFQRAGMITELAAYSGRFGFRHVSVCNWEKYQGFEDPEGTSQQQVSDMPRQQDDSISRACLEHIKSTNVRSSVLGNPTLFGEEESQHQEIHEVKNQTQELRIKQRIWFEEFWSRYWLKKARQDAEKAFYVHVNTDELFQVVLKARDAQTPEMMAREPSKRPHGATWINGKRWNDEVVEAEIATHHLDPWERKQAETDRQFREQMKAELEKENHV